MNKILLQGTVTKSTGSFYNVKATDGNFYLCVIKGNFRIQGIRSTNPVSVGDHVVFEKTEDQEYCVINELLERKNYIIRKSTNLSKKSHIVAANIDQAMLIVTLKFPETPTEFIDRYLVTAEAYKIQGILVFNKSDIYNDEERKVLHYLKSVYEKIGYPCVETSVVENKNIDVVKDFLKDKITLVSGLSGVGKSSLINVVEPTLNLKTSMISDYHKSGVHTTTFAEMFELGFGGSIIDTPGIRGFGVVDIDKNELYHHFPEIFRASKNCRFYNCTHVHEPECAVIELVEKGEIDLLRYKSYMNLFHDEGKKYRY